MLHIFLQAQQGGFDFNFVIMMLLMVVVFYFFMIRPQQKKQKEEKKFQEELKIGTKVVTISGIHGKVAELTEDAVVIETGAGKIKFERTSISKELSASRYPTSTTIQKN
ncbi:MAG: preprotein translocase subunit YajC [Flavobacteriales bacterium]|nr:preprotein translocase subunit YajC [Flavobacteriales bacterium]